MLETEEYLLDIAQTFGEICPLLESKNPYAKINMPLIEDLARRGKLIETVSADPSRRRFVPAPG